MPKTNPRDKGNRPDDTEGSIARRYEGGHGAPYSPVTPETSSPDAPVIDEMKGRDRQDGKSDSRRERRGRGPQSGPPEPEESAAGQSARAPARDNALPQGRQRQRRSHRTLQ